MSPLLPFLLLTGAQQSPPAEFLTRNGLIRIYDYATIKSDADSGETVVDGGQRPMTLTDNANGLTLKGLRMSVVIVTLADGTRQLSSAKLVGQAQASVDSKLAYTTALQTVPTTPKPAVFTKTVVNSEVMTYAGGEKTGVLNLTSASEIVSDSVGDAISVKAGQTIRTPFTQKIIVTGKAGQVVLAPQAQSPRPPIQTARLAGPVNFSLVRKETPAPGQVSTTNVQGVGDTLDADLASEVPTITLSGNVSLSGNGPGLGGRVEGEKAVVFLSEDLKPARYEFVGKPTTTRIQMNEKNTGGPR